jgi:hypothetical protein
MEVPMSATPLLQLPYLAAAQAQKHVTHNEALNRLDALIQLNALGRRTAPPLAPVEGERWLIEGGATGPVSGHDNHIGCFQDGAWSFFAPLPGWLLWIDDDAALHLWDGAAWTPIQRLFADLGVNATPDATNRFALASPASLFNHEGAGHQLKINKHAGGDNASILFQTGFSGRAEFGLAGDDDFHIKVSADGASWTEAMLVDRTTGHAAFPAGGVRELLSADRTFHVRPDGNDGNDGRANSSARAFATPQRAIDAALALDLGLYDVEILVAPGTYSGNIEAYGVQAGTGTLTLRGTGSAAADVVLSAATGDAVTMGRGARMDLKNLTLTAPTGRGIAAADGAALRFAGVDFGMCGSAHIYATSARIEALGA